MPYFDEPLERVKIQTTSKNSQLHYTTKRLIRDLLSNTRNCYVFAGEFGGKKYFFKGNAWQKYAKRNGIGQLQQTCQTGPLSGVQIPRDICTRFGRYLYSMKCSWIINCSICNEKRKFEFSKCSYMKRYFLLDWSIKPVIFIASSQGFKPGWFKAVSLSLLKSFNNFEVADYRLPKLNHRGLAFLVCYVTMLIELSVTNRPL